VCRDLWHAVFRKPVDNLKTNHRGVFVLTDNSLRWLTALAPVTMPGGPALGGPGGPSGSGGPGGGGPGGGLGPGGGPGGGGGGAQQAGYGSSPMGAPPPGLAAQAALRAAAAAHLHLPCGLIRGALTQLGVPCSVEAEPKGLPACAFIVKVAGV